MLIPTHRKLQIEIEKGDLKLTPLYSIWIHPLLNEFFRNLNVIFLIRLDLVVVQIYRDVIDFAHFVKLRFEALFFVVCASSQMKKPFRGSNNRIDHSNNALIIILGVANISGVEKMFLQEI